VLVALAPPVAVAVVVVLPPAPPAVESVVVLATSPPVPPTPVVVFEAEAELLVLPPVGDEVVPAPLLVELDVFEDEDTELVGPPLVSEALVAVPMVGPVGPALGPWAVKPPSVPVSLSGEVSTTVAQDAINTSPLAAKAGKTSARFRGKQPVTMLVLKCQLVANDFSNKPR
jgi:hypothetical protein